MGSGSAPKSLTIVEEISVISEPRNTRPATATMEMSARRMSYSVSAAPDWSLRVAEMNDLMSAAR